MDIHTEIQRCRDECAKTADELRSLTNTLHSQRAKEALTGGAYFLERCINDCDQAINQIKK